MNSCSIEAVSLLGAALTVIIKSLQTVVDSEFWIVLQTLTFYIPIYSTFGVLISISSSENLMKLNEISESESSSESSSSSSLSSITSKE